MNTEMPMKMSYQPTYTDEYVTAAFEQVQHMCHVRSYNAGWWHDPVTLRPLFPDTPNGYGDGFQPYVIATKIALIHSEVSEAMEGSRTDAMDDKLPHRLAIECELADAMIRIFDLAGALDLDLIGAILEKSKFNTSRPDHAIANRLKPGGKKF